MSCHIYNPIWLIGILLLVALRFEIENSLLESTKMITTTISAPVTLHNYGVAQMKEGSTVVLRESASSLQVTKNELPPTGSAKVSFNDETIPWPESWKTTLEQQPSIDKPAQILLTNYGWNHPNKTFGLTHARSIRQRQLIQGILEHPWFRPVSWDKVSSQLPNVTTYVFLDVETCFETNWPRYGNVGGLNNDSFRNRSTTFDPRGYCCSIQKEALEKPIFQSPKTRLVIFDCSGNGPCRRFCCLNVRNVNKTSVVSISAPAAKHTSHDLGLPPPAGKQINLSKQQIHDVETCNEDSRPFLYTFAGSFAMGSFRKQLKPLHNGKDVIVVRDAQRDVSMSYQDMLLKSMYAGTPRGDNLFSYRFTEAMSAGAIPVVHADSWVLPFSSKLINWKKCAVVIPEARVNETLEILSNITSQDRCEMRKCVLNAYQRFMSSPKATIDGIIKSLELVKQK